MLKPILLAALPVVIAPTLLGQCSSNGAAPGVPTFIQVGSTPVTINRVVTFDPATANAVIPHIGTGVALGISMDGGAPGACIRVLSYGMAVAEFDSTPVVGQIATFNGDMMHSSTYTSATQVPSTFGISGRIEIATPSVCANCALVNFIRPAQFGGYIAASTLNNDLFWGPGVQSGAINSSNHLILTLLSGSTLDVGAVVGPTGPTGNSGANGVTPTLASGTITTLAAGASATASLSGTAPNYSLNLGLPQGVAGSNGTSPTITVGTVSTLVAGASATATLTGTYPAYTLNLGIPVGATGASGVFYSGTSPSISSSVLALGSCASTTMSVPGATTSMMADLSPITNPGNALQWKAYVSAAGTVTVQECAILALTTVATAYNVRVFN